MPEFIEWVNQHGLALIGSLVALFVVISKITPTPKDDAWAAQLLNWLNLLPQSAKNKLNTGKVNDTPKE